MAKSGPGLSDSFWSEVLEEPLPSDFLSFNAEFNPLSNFSFSAELTYGSSIPLLPPIALFAQPGPTATGPEGSSSVLPAPIDNAPLRSAEPSDEPESTSTAPSTSSSPTQTLRSRRRRLKKELTDESVSFDSSEKELASLRKQYKSVEVAFEQAKTAVYLNSQDKKLACNRLTAQLSRLRKWIKEQEDRVALEQSKEQIAQLQAENMQLKETIARLEAEKLADKSKAAQQECFEIDFKTPSASLHLQYNSPSKVAAERKRGGDGVSVSVASGGEVKSLRSRRMNFSG